MTAAEPATSPAPGPRGAAPGEDDTKSDLAARNVSAVGLATGRTGQPGSWTDHGVVASTSRDDFNAIDPYLLVDDGSWWPSFGSFRTGIKVVRLDAAAGRPHRGARTVALAARPDEPHGAVEAPALIRRARHYFLFLSFDYCCRGLDSTYKVAVGRAERPTGPFVDRSGRHMLDGGGTVVLTGGPRRVGPAGRVGGRRRFLPGAPQLRPRGRRRPAPRHYPLSGGPTMGGPTSPDRPDKPA